MRLERGIAKLGDLQQAVRPQVRTTDSVGADHARSMTK